MSKHTPRLITSETHPSIYKSRSQAANEAATPGLNYAAGNVKNTWTEYNKSGSFIQWILPNIVLILIKVEPSFG